VLEGLVCIGGGWEGISCYDWMKPRDDIVSRALNKMHIGLNEPHSFTHPYIPKITNASESLNDLAHLEFDIVYFYMKMLNENIEL
jgi:hypothetical protein